MKLPEEQVKPDSEPVSLPSPAGNSAAAGPVAPGLPPEPESVAKDVPPPSPVPVRIGHQNSGAGDVNSKPEESIAEKGAPRTDGLLDHKLGFASLAQVMTRDQASPLADLGQEHLPAPKEGTPANPLESALHEGNWMTETVRRGDTISHIFRRLGISIREALALVKLKDAAVLEKITPGEEIHVTKLTPMDGTTRERLEKLKYELNQFTTLLVRRKDDGYVTDIVRREPEIHYRTSRATINSSLLGTARNAGIPFDVVYSFADILGWQVDFSRDLRKGDQFTVIFEELYLDGEKIGNGQVVAAELITMDRSLRAVRHVGDNGRVTYYAPDGEGIQGSFLRSPIKYARVTSSFSKRRLHPIQKIWKPHNGVDYGAPLNTPVHSTGDGVVIFIGSKNGYGRTIILRHGEQYQTLYAHLNHYRKGLRTGKRVEQGEVIGYVGKTGWATGPHLHYEFRVNGRHMDPLTVELPKSDPIDQRYRVDFLREAAHWVAQLESADPIPLAQNDP